MADFRSDGNFRKEEEELAALIAKAAEGDQDSFCRIAQLFGGSLYRLVSGFVVPESEKDDLFQEGLIGLYKAVQLYRPQEAGFHTFATLCMRSSILSWLKKYNKKFSLPETPSDAQIENIPARFSDPASLVIGEETRQRMMQKIGSALSPLEYRVLTLHLEDKRESEIALILGKSRKSVDNALCRCRTKLKSFLE